MCFHETLDHDASFVRFHLGHRLRWVEDVGRCYVLPVRVSVTESMELWDIWLCPCPVHWS